MKGKFMRKIVVVGKTDCTINLNKIGVPIRGKSVAVLTINNTEQENELNEMLGANLIEVLEDSKNVIKTTDAIEVQNLTSIYPSKKEINNLVIKDYKKEIKEIKEIKAEVKEEIKEEIKRKVGRPKSKETVVKIKGKPGRPPKVQPQVPNIPATTTPLSLQEEERIRTVNAENKTQQRGSKVTMVTNKGIISGKMTDSLVYNAENNTELIKASIDAMKKTEKEELEEIEKDDHKINFIDAVVKSDSEDDDTNDIFIDNDDDDKPDPFIEI